MNENFSNELLKVVKKPKTEVELKAEKQKEHEEHVKFLSESLYKKIKENLFVAAKKGTSEIDENMNFSPTDFLAKKIQRDLF